MSYDRIKRAQKDKLFLVDIKSTDSLFEKHFSVMGTTGNIYKVKIDVNNQSCNCPDYIRRRSPCKHVFFVFLKVLKSSEDFGKYLDESNLLDLFDNLENLTKKLYATDELRDAYIKQIKQDSTSYLNNNNLGIKDQKKDENCPICMDALENGEEIDFCKYGCGKSIHLQCFTMWCKKSPNSEKKCVYCRTEWDKKENKNFINDDDSDFPNEYFNVYEATNKGQAARPRFNPFWNRRRKRTNNLNYDREYDYYESESTESFQEYGDSEEEESEGV